MNTACNNLYLESDHGPLFSPSNWFFLNTRMFSWNNEVCSCTRHIRIGVNNFSTLVLLYKRIKMSELRWAEKADQPPLTGHCRFKNNSESSFWKPLKWSTSNNWEIPVTVATVNRLPWCASCIQNFNHWYNGAGNIWDWFQLNFPQNLDSLRRHPSLGLKEVSHVSNIGHCCQ